MAKLELAWSPGAGRAGSAPGPCAGLFVTWRGSRSWSAASWGSLERTTALWISASTMEEGFVLRFGFFLVCVCWFFFSFTLSNLYLCWTLRCIWPSCGDASCWQCAGLERRARGRQQGWLWFACYINLFIIFPSEGLGTCTSCINNAWTKCTWEYVVFLGPLVAKAV